MQLDFHYYATYCAAFLAGYSHEESMEICYSAQFCDNCTRTFLDSIGGPDTAATTQLTMEMAAAKTDTVGRQDITRIWSSFHFLPHDLYAQVKGGKDFKNKYRLICRNNGALVADTVNLAKGKGLQAAGVAMHVLADTWAHAYFAGTPSMAINNTNYHFYEVRLVDGEWIDKRVTFGLTSGEDLENSKYINTVSTNNENSVMSLGHGQAGHLPDYSCMRYRYMPAWSGYEEVLKDNPSDYYHAFSQMVYALKYLRGEIPAFELEHYDFETVAPYEDEIRGIFEKRQLDDCADWKALGEKLSGCEIADFDTAKYMQEYIDAPSDQKDETFLGKFINAALAQKGMVTDKIFKSGNLLAGYTVEDEKKEPPKAQKPAEQKAEEVKAPEAAEQKTEEVKAPEAAKQKAEETITQKAEEAKAQEAEEQKAEGGRS